MWEELPNERIGVDVPGLIVGGSGIGVDNYFGGLFMFDFDGVHDESLVVVRIVSLIVCHSLLHFNNIVIDIY